VLKEELVGPDPNAFNCRKSFLKNVYCL